MRQRRWIELLSDYECEIKLPTPRDLEAQSEASKDLKAPAEWLRGLERHFEQRADGEIYFFDHKMYYDLRDLYWWPGMKRDIAETLGTRLDMSTAYTSSDIGQSSVTIQDAEEYAFEPVELSCVHDMFHVLNLKKCLAEPDVQVHLDEIKIDENLCFVEEPLEIVERDVKKLKRRRIPLVKVRWNSRQGAKYTWEREDQIQKKYPHLHPEPVPSSNVAT
ncbi:hypothetical protein Tco_1355449 [Tanacetum coccineum]